MRRIIGSDIVLNCIVMYMHMCCHQPGASSEALGWIIATTPTLRYGAKEIIGPYPCESLLHEYEQAAPLHKAIITHVSTGIDEVCTGSRCECLRAFNGSCVKSPLPCDSASSCDYVSSGATCDEASRWVLLGHCCSLLIKHSPLFFFNIAHEADFVFIPILRHLVNM